VEPSPFNISISNVFYFVMYNRSVSDTSGTFISHYFNITEAESTSSTLTSANSTPSPTLSGGLSTSTFVSSVSPGSTKSVAPSNNTSAPPAKLSQGAEIGIIVTVLAVGIIALSGGFLLFRRRKRMRSAEDPTNYNWKSELEAKSARGIVPGGYEGRITSFPETIHEVPGSQTVAAELDGSYGKMI
jgi:hypothetical protein